MKIQSGGLKIISMEKKFITTGMNHVDEGPILFNEINKSWMKKIWR